MISESLREKLDWDAEETLERVYSRIAHERILFGATIVIEDLIRHEDRAFIKWLRHLPLRPAIALADIEKAPYTKVSSNEEPGRPTPAGRYILTELNRLTMVTNVELGKIALRALAHYSSSSVRKLFFGERNDIDWQIDQLGVEYSQASGLPGWWDYFADSPGQASKGDLCYIGEPIRNEVTASYVGDVVWFGVRRNITGEPALNMLWFLYQRLRDNSPMVDRSEIIAYWKQLDLLANDPRPEKQQSLLSEPALVKQEVIKYWLNLPNIG